MGAQFQTRTSILGGNTVGPSFDGPKQFTSVGPLPSVDPLSSVCSSLDARKHFCVQLEDSSNSPVVLPSSVERLKDLLYYASSSINYALGIGFYMIPSSLNLQTCKVKDYNSAIVIV